MGKKGFFITGTDTGVGKTFFASILMKKFNFDYWKPIQTGKFLENDTILSVIPLSFIISPAAIKKGIANKVNESTPENILVTIALKGKSP